MHVSWCRQVFGLVAKRIYEKYPCLLAVASRPPEMGSAFHVVGRRWSFPLTAAGQFRIYTGFPVVCLGDTVHASREAYRQL